MAQTKFKTLPRSVDKSMMRSVCRFAFLAKLILLPILGAHSHARANDGFVASQMLISEAQALADKVAQALNSRQFTNRSAVDFMNEEWTKNFEKSSRQLAEDVSNFKTLAGNATPEGLDTPQFEAKSQKGFRKFMNQMVLGTTLGTIGAELLATCFLDMPAFRDVGFAYVLFPVISAASVGLPMLTRSSDRVLDAAKRKAWAKFRAEIQNVFFSRLSQLNVKFDRADPVGWLNSQLDGNPVPNWDTLTSAQKAEAANSFIHSIELIGVNISANEQASREILDIAKTARANLPGKWYPFWGKKTSRMVAKLLGESYQRVMELNKTHQFIKNVADNPHAYADQRILIDHPELFSPRAREYLLQSRLPLPKAFDLQIPMLTDLGGVVDIESKSSILEKTQFFPRRGTTQFTVSISFPNRPELVRIEIPFALTYATDATDTGLLHLTDVANEKFRFNEEFTSALSRSEALQKLTMAHEQALPEQHCQTALSVPQTLQSVKEAAEAAVGTY